MRQVEVHDRHKPNTKKMINAEARRWTMGYIHGVTSSNLNCWKTVCSVHGQTPFRGPQPNQIAAYLGIIGTTNLYDYRSIVTKLYSKKNNRQK